MKIHLLNAAFVLIACFFAVCSYQPVRVDGNAMMPAFNDGDKILIDKNLGELKRGEVVIFLYPKDQSKSYIKRIIGLAKETIEIREGQTFINGQKLNESYVSESFNQAKLNFPPQIIPDNQYFLMGDNRDNSSDSRYWERLMKS